jgi:DNA-binding helix-hairpin-helix protein with protein kinase domain
MMHHPLEGKKELAIKCLDLPAMKKLYGTEPVFIFDPADDSNAPDPQHQRNPLAFWSIYPKFLRTLFTRAFTEGISDPQHGRVRESNWRAAMVRLRDSIIYCAHCNAENFHDAGEPEEERVRAGVGPAGINSTFRRACAWGLIS